MPETDTYSLLSSMENVIEKIHKAALKFLVPLKPYETYKKIVDEAVKLIKGQDGVIHIKEGDALVNIYASSPELLSFQARPKGYAYTSMASKKAYVLQLKQFKKLYPEVAARGVKSVVFIPLFYKDQTFGVLAVRSHTDQEFTQKELHILELFGTLADLAIRKTQLYSEAQNTIELKEKFIAMAAHELRTPLTTMSGYVQLLHKRMAGKDDSESKWTESLLTETYRLQNLIEELLEVNRLNAGKLDYNFNESDIEAVIKRALERLLTTYPNVKIKYHKKSRKSSSVSGDEKKLAQALFNVLDNAVKFSSYDTEIKVGLVTNKTYSIISIQDKGKGIDKKEIPRILGGFYKATGNEQEGMGVGLYYTKSIVEKHHGEMVIQSQVNKGTTIEIKLPNIKYGRTNNKLR